MNHLRPCGVHGCRSPVRSRFSPWCSGHRKALLRHGDARQAAIKAAALRPWEALIEARQKANEGSQAWVLLRRRWESILAQADAWIAHKERTGYYVKHEVHAAELLQRVSKHADQDKVIRTAMAVAMHSVHDPRAYVSDRALRYQLVRRVIKLAPIYMGKAWDHKTRKMQAVSRDIPTRTMEVLAELLFPAFAGAGAQLHAVEQRRKPPEEVERQRLADAIALLTA